MNEDDPSFLDRSGVFYVSQSEQRRKLTRRAQWCLWAVLAGFVAGLMVMRLI